MEKKKNEAVEKVENIAGDGAKKTTTKKVSVKKSNGKKESKPTSKKPIKKSTVKQKSKRDNQKIKEQKEQERAQKRIELAKIKAEKKAEKQKIKAQKQKDRLAHKEKVKAHRQEIKHKRQERKAFLKAESKQDKQKRLKEEKQARIRAKKELELQKAEIRRQKAELKKQKATEKNNRKQHKQTAKNNQKSQKQKNRTKGYGGWLAAVISLGVAVLVLSSVLTMTVFMPTEIDTTLASAYEKSYYETVDYVNDMDIDMAKILASADKKSQQKYFNDLSVNSELAENGLNSLPIKDEFRYYTAKLINQIGDYSKYLSNKLIDGEEITSEEWKNFEMLYSANKDLQSAFAKINQAISGGYNFNSLLSGKESDAVLKNMNELQQLSANYPELIYDGPFSDGLTAKTPKGLSDKEISVDDAKQVLLKGFDGFITGEIKELGEVKSKFDCYNFSAVTVDGTLYAEVSKSGELITAEEYSYCNEPIYSAEDCIEFAQKFLEDIGLTNMEAVWCAEYEGQATINFVYEENGVLYYPDMVKLTVCQGNGQVTAFDAVSYYMNHTERSVGEAKISRSQAQKALKTDIEVLTTRLTLIPVGQKEVLAYEFSGELGGDRYYIYIDANSCAQVEMFKVISSEQGETLM